MSRFRQVPGIAQGPKGFTPASFVPMQSPLGQPPQQPQSPAAVDGNAEQMQDLAMEIYSQLAIDLIRSSQTTNLDLLRQMAKHSQVAALAYFEELGVEFAEQSQEEV